MIILNNNIILLKISFHDTKGGSIDKHKLIAFIQSRPALAESLSINDSKIDLKTKKAQNAFLKLMDDSYLYSLLTDIDCTSNSKDRDN